MKILNNVKKEHYPNKNIETVAVDALNITLKPASFDMVVGHAILHHLIDVRHFFQVSYNALREKGVAVFTEPMMSGNLILLSLLKTLLNVNELQSRKFTLKKQTKLNSKIVKFFNDYIVTLTVLSNAHSKMNLCKITDLDDKHLFTKQTIEYAAGQAGFNSVYFYNCKNAPRYKNHLAGLLNFVSIDYQVLPNWVQDIVQIYDESDINYENNDILFTAVIVCTKQ